jgi:phosphate transport system substrate-binding protein
VASLSTAPAAANARDDVRIVCDGAVEKTVRRLLTSAEARQRGIDASVLPAMEPTDAVQAVIRDEVDVLLIANPVPLPEHGEDLAVTAWAATPVILAANERVPVTDLKLDDLVAMLGGWTTHWPDGTRVRLLLPPQSWRDLQSIQHASPGVAYAIDRALKRPGMAIVNSDAELIDMLEAVPGSVGFSTLAMLLSRERQVKPLLIDGVEPSLAAEQFGLYRIERTVSLVRRRSPPLPVREVVAFLLSERHEGVLRSRGLRPASSPMAFRD